MEDAKFPALVHKAIYARELVFKTSSLGSENRQDCIGKRCCSSDTTLQRKCHGLKLVEALKRDYRVTFVGDVIFGFQPVPYLFFWYGGQDFAASCPRNSNPVCGGCSGRYITIETAWYAVHSSKNRRRLNHSTPFRECSCCSPKYSHE